MSAAPSSRSTGKEGRIAKPGTEWLKLGLIGCVRHLKGKEKPARDSDGGGREGSDDPWRER